MLQLQLDVPAFEIRARWWQKARRVALQRLMGVVFLLGMHGAWAQEWILNDPYPAREALQSIYYSSFSTQPKTLDPARSYEAGEYQFILQIYEPLLQYNYLARPYQLEPLTTVSLPDVRYYDAQGVPLQEVQEDKVAQTVYTLRIQPGILYQPHPAFAKDELGQFHYHSLSNAVLHKYHIRTIADFEWTGTRELVADDYIYQLKRLANPATGSPVYGVMGEHVQGFKSFGEALPLRKASQPAWLDLRQYPLSGVRKIDEYTFEVVLEGHYPQFIFWLAMPFFAPVPWEVEYFYSQPGMQERNLTLAWYPVGTGPFLLEKNDPNSHIVLVKNPNYREVYYPTQGSEQDRAAGFLQQAGKRLPLVEKAIYTLEKESLPRWNKFLQGYYDLSGISADSFDQAIQMTASGDTNLSPGMQEQGIVLSQTVEPSVYFLGFNWLDSVVGGNSLRAKKLRQAISIAVNDEEYIALFYNGRGQVAQGPIPPGIFGYQKGELGTNPVVYQWKDGKRIRRSLEHARALMREAGYPGGIEPTTGKPLILHYDTISRGGADERAHLDWMRKQFDTLGIALNIRTTQYNQFQEKIRHGNAQLFSWGWGADYPDPENFLSLLYGPNGKVRYGGENATNYSNAAYDALFMQMKNRKNDATRQQLIDRMVAILREDAPWGWGINGESFVLAHQWVSPVKPNPVSNNTLKYMGINVAIRRALQLDWNHPILFVFVLILCFVVVLLLLLMRVYWVQENQKARRKKLIN